MNKKTVLTIFGIVVGILVSAAVYFTAMNKPSQPVALIPLPTDKTATWQTYSNTGYGYEIKYPGTSSVTSLDSDNDRLYVSNVKIGDIAIIRVLSKSNLATSPKRCVDEKTLSEQVICEYLVLGTNSNSVSQQKFGDNNFVYADFEAIDHPNVRTRTIWAFAEKNGYIYQLEALNPDSEEEVLFKDVVSTFTFLR